MKSALQRMISFTLIVKYLKKNLHVMTPNSKQISPVPWPYVLVLLCVIFFTYMCCPRLCSHGGWLLLNCSAIGIGFNGAETNCGIARILGILLKNSWDSQIYFLATTIICSLSNLNYTEVQTIFIKKKSMLTNFKKRVLNYFYFTLACPAGQFRLLANCLTFCFPFSLSNQACCQL